MMCGLAILGIVVGVALFLELIFLGYALQEDWGKWYICFIIITLSSFISIIIYTGKYYDYEEQIKAQCTTVNGTYGGGKCYKDGKEVIE